MRKTTQQIVSAGLAAHYIEQHPELAKAVWQLVEGGQTVKQIHAWALQVIGSNGNGITAEGVRALAKHYTTIKNQ